MNPSHRCQRPFLAALTALTALSLLTGGCSTSPDFGKMLGEVFSNDVTSEEVALGLKQALEQGITRGSAALSQQGGYLNSPYRIQLPAEARKVTDLLSGVPGFQRVEALALEKINQAAEDAARSAQPIFINAIRSITLPDALGILMGQPDAATAYLRERTYEQLVQEFRPVVIDSLDKFQARTFWTETVTAYNRLPLVERVEPNLEDYIVREALRGLFDVVAKEEARIRTDLNARSTSLMRRVFALQDRP